MRPNRNAKKSATNVRGIFLRLFSAPATAIHTAPAHQVRLWLDRVKLELTRERNRGKARHYRYDINKHIALAAARNELTMRLVQLEKR